MQKRKLTLTPQADEDLKKLEEDPSKKKVLKVDLSS